MTDILCIKNLTKKFENNTALDSINFNLPKGCIVGLIGPDGSGKTTLIRLLIGLLTPTSGEISILGFNPSSQTDELHKKIGYMPQKFGLYEDLTVIENLNLYADLKKLPPQEKSSIFETLLSLTNLTPFTQRLAGN